MSGTVLGAEATKTPPSERSLLQSGEALIGGLVAGGGFLQHQKQVMEAFINLAQETMIPPDEVQVQA